MIPIQLLPPHLQDTDDNLPHTDNDFHLLANLYEAYLHYLNNATRTTLNCVNILRGILNNAI